MPTNDAAARAKISASLRGNLNRAKWGKARRVTPIDRKLFRAELGRRIQDRRLELDITRDELAAASGVNIWCILRIELARVDAKFSSIVRIALALGCMPAELVP